MAAVRIASMKIARTEGNIVQTLGAYCCTEDLLYLNKKVNEREEILCSK